MPALRDIKEVTKIIKAKGSLELAVIKYGEPKGRATKIPQLVVPLGVTLNELIEYIQVTGQCAGRHLTYAERNDIETD